MSTRVPPSAPAATPADTAMAPGPAPGTLRYWVLLYSPAPRRATLATLLGLADEIGAGTDGPAEHAVIHARLDWWRQEAQRFGRGEPRHPWLRSLHSRQPESRGLDLLCLVDAAASDLAARSVRAEAGSALPRALFVLLAQALGARDCPPPLRQCLGEIGRLTHQIECAARERTPAPELAGAALESLHVHAQRIDTALQPLLAPLLVWAALAAARWRRRQRRTGDEWAARLDGFADNMLAWRAARRAARGRFRIH